MKQLFLALVMVAVSGGAWAQWVEVSANERGTVFYVDPTTIKQNGNLRRYWMLTNLAKADKDGDLSYRALAEVDCKEERTRRLQEDYFRAPMASGQGSGGLSSPTEWRYVAPGTSGESLMKFVCSQ